MQKEITEVDCSKDWTADTNRVCNNSTRYLELVEEVRRLIMGDAHMLLAGHAEKTARLIMSHLAHLHNLAPMEPTQ